MKKPIIINYIEFIWPYASGFSSFPFLIRDNFTFVRCLILINIKYNQLEVYYLRKKNVKNVVFISRFGSITEKSKCIVIECGTFVITFKAQYSYSVLLFSLNYFQIFLYNVICIYVHICRETRKNQRVIIQIACYTTTII